MNYLLDQPLNPVITKNDPLFAAASFLKGGIALRHKSVSKESLATFVDSCVSARLDILNAIKDAHPDFLRIEKTRIFLNAANTFFRYCSYDAKINKLNRATISQESKKLIQKYRSTIAAYLECLNQPENIILPECRAILKDCKDTDSIPNTVRSLQIS